MSNRMYASVTNTSSIYQVRFTEAHNDSAPIVVIDCNSTSLTIGDAVTVYIGYVGDNDKIFTGYVKSIVDVAAPAVKKITAYGKMIRAVDFFIASSDPNEPYSRGNVSAEALVEDIINLSGLTDYGYDATSFTFGVQGPVEVNLTSSYDFCRMIADLLAWHIYADINGKVWFVDRKPYVMGWDSSSAEITVPSIINAAYLISERDLRNRGLCLLDIANYLGYGADRPNVKITSTVYDNNGRMFIRTDYETPVGKLHEIKEMGHLTIWWHKKLFSQMKISKPSSDNSTSVTIDI